MQAPQLADFGASERDQEIARTVRRWLLAVAIVGSLAVFIAAMSLAQGDKLKGLAQAIAIVVLLASCPLPPFGPMLFHLLAKTVARHFSPAFRRADAYERALAQYEKWWIRTQEQFWRGLSGHAFEAELAALYRRLGVQADVTSAENDRGVDLWITLDGERTPVQCKAHRRPVTPSAARELYGTMKSLGARCGVLASVSGFTTGTVQFSAAHGIQLLALADILAMQKRVK